MSGRRRREIDALVARARRLLRGGDVAAADAAARRAVALSPHDQRARLVHAFACLRLSRPNDALHTLDAADWYAGGRYTTIKTLARASALARLGRTREAIALLSDLLIAEPRHRAATLRLVALLIETGEHEAAIDRLQRYRARAGEDRRTDLLLARALQRAGRCDAAMELLAGHAGESPAALARVARLAARAGRFADAFDAYDRLVRTGFDEPDTATAAARLAVRFGDDRRAARYLDVALAADADHAPAHRLLVAQHLRCGRFEAAARVCWRRSRRDGSDVEAAAGLIVAALCAGRHGFADRLLADFAARFDSPTRRAAMCAAWRSAMSGLVLRSVRDAEAGIAPNDVLGVLLRDASATLTRAADAKPLYADLHHHRATCLAALGETAAAIDAADRALAMNPRYLAAVSLRVSLAVGAGALEEARRTIDAASARQGEASELAAMSVALRALERSPAEAMTAAREKSEDDAAGARLMKAAAEQLRRWGKPEDATRLASAGSGRGDYRARAA